MSNLQFKRVRTLQPRRSVHDLSYEKKLTCDMGQLIPILCEEVVPGDIFTIGNQAIVRFQPLVAPVLHPVDMFVHYFFIPNRIMWDSWETFITGGKDGTDVIPLPYWEPSNTAIGSLWDYMGFPTGIDPDGAYPVDFPRIAYNKVYNQFYRDENLQAEVLETNETILNRNWEKDYFTSSLLSQQRGIAPALPISGTTHALWPSSAFVRSSGGAPIGVGSSITDKNIYIPEPGSLMATEAALENNTVDLSGASTFDVSDMRLAFQIQKWMERNNRAGVRYTEFLHAHFAVSPSDNRLDRPEYIGGSKSHIIFSEVLQTSSTDGTSPQGNLAGHGINVSESFCGKYRVEEYGLIIGIMSVMPRPAYQNGINRQWLKTTRYDYYFPEFANLSEQAIINAEICAKDGDSVHNQTIFGYQGRYDEMRTKSGMVCGLMRTTYDYWHLGRQFDPATPPELNDVFVECIPRKDIFAAPSEPGLIVQFGNLIKAVRPIPIMAEPGLIDHD